MDNAKRRAGVKRNFWLSDCTSCAHAQQCCHSMLTSFLTIGMKNPYIFLHKLKWKTQSFLATTFGFSVQFALPNFLGDDDIDDVFNWSWWWEKVAHKIWWWCHNYVMRYSLSKLTAYTYLRAFISGISGPNIWLWNATY